jgi:hypothetical protein
MSKRPDRPEPARPAGPDESDETPKADDDAKVEKRDPSGGPTTVGWWLDDGPESPIAADIAEPEKHL